MSGSCTMKTCWMRLPSFRVIGDILKDRYDGASHVASSGRRNNNVRSNRPPKSPNNNIASNSIHAKRENKRKHKYSFQLKPFNPEHKPPSSQDLVYYEMSPGFCEKNPKLGIMGTHGRTCNETSPGVDGCDIMCCGRGYRPQDVVLDERCNCTFFWCCEVKCDLCRIERKIHICL